MVTKGGRFIDFNLPAEAGGFTRLSERLNQQSPLLLIFYKFNCPTCQFAFQYLPRISKGLDEGHFLAVAQDELDEILQFKMRYGIGFDILSDGHPYKVSDQYGLKTVPTFFVIEKDGTVSERAEGFDRKCIEDFANRVALLKQKTGFSAFQPHEQVPLLKPG